MVPEVLPKSTQGKLFTRVQHRSRKKTREKNVPQNVTFAFLPSIFPNCSSKRKQSKFTKLQALWHRMKKWKILWKWSPGRKIMSGWFLLAANQQQQSVLLVPKEVFYERNFFFHPQPPSTHTCAVGCSLENIPSSSPSISLAFRSIVFGSLSLIKLNLAHRNFPQSDFHRSMPNGRWMMLDEVWAGFEEIIKF